MTGIVVLGLAALSWLYEMTGVVALVMVFAVLWGMERVFHAR